MKVIAHRVMCKSKRHISAHLHGIVDENGEGVVLRKAGSLYEHGRNKSLMKLKVQ